MMKKKPHWLLNIKKNAYKSTIAFEKRILNFESFSFWLQWTSNVGMSSDSFKKKILFYSKNCDNGHNEDWSCLALQKIQIYDFQFFINSKQCILQKFYHFFTIVIFFKNLQIFSKISIFLEILHILQKSSNILQNLKKK
jgi:hypothetical protein